MAHLACYCQKFLTFASLQQFYIGLLKMVVFPVIMSCVVHNFCSQFAAARYHGISVTGASAEEDIFHE